jgi:DNA-binding NtrC family response regulator
MIVSRNTRDVANSLYNLLVVDDEPHVCDVIAGALEPLSIRVFKCSSAEDALSLLSNENIDIILSDLRMPGMDGLAFLKRLREEHYKSRFVLFSAYGQMDTVIQALRLGASDFISKPFDNTEVRAIISRILRVPAEVPFHVETKGTRPSEIRLPGMVGASPNFLKCLETARRAAMAGSTVLITGESGTGKEGVARFIHDESERREQAFISVNCGAVPEALMESELFGHVRGAFTGAVSDRPGKFTLADRGTIFLDEIGEMSQNMQVRFLRVLQERVVEPVGGGVGARSDFRVISATNRDLREAVRVGSFREDLWFRLNVIQIALPPLRERGQDVILLASHFLDYFNQRYGAAYTLGPEHSRLLFEYSWPGNVRELANIIERAVVLSEGPHLSLEIDASNSSLDGGAPTISDHTVRGRRRAAEREVILAALEACRWNKTQAAERLGISRRGLLYKVKEYGIG